MGWDGDRVGGVGSGMEWSTRTGYYLLRMWCDGVSNVRGVDAGSLSLRTILDSSSELQGEIRRPRL